MPNDRSINPTPAAEANTTGILNVHLIIPIELKNSDIKGFITKQLTIMPITVEIITAGIKDIAVCKISCFVVKPSDFKMP